MLKTLKTKTLEEMLDNPRAWGKMLLDVAEDMDRRRAAREKKAVDEIESVFGEQIVRVRTTKTTVIEEFIED